MKIQITEAGPDRRREKPAGDKALGFGKLFSDHMFLMDYREGHGWKDPRIVPYGPLALPPTAVVLHYAQEIFEGLKAYYAKDGGICLFRPERNAERMNRSATRLCMPSIPVEDQIEAIRELVRIDREWIPRSNGASLYIRPAMIATESALGVHPSTEYLFFIVTGPVGAYYARGFEPVNILVEENYIRATRGGLGEAKTGANYAASILAAKEAKAKGFDQVLWLDAEHRRFVEEVGTMNIFFVFGGELVTPPLSGSILPGVTRDSVIELARDWKIPVLERPVEIDEVIRRSEDGSLTEAFGSGTAAVISPVGAFSFRGRNVRVGDSRVGELSRRLYDEITGIQYGVAEDRHRWVHRVE
ncbi:MAG: branched-chain amino acid aminotransferase [Deltaproteobacteria bacterium]|nr:branched-chain amino acid aminotransferase [Deltaproteobacteria bacterium]